MQPALLFPSVATWWRYKWKSGNIKLAKLTNLSLFHHVVGAPEEIRTPDPQIRRLRPGVEKPANFCKPDAFGTLKHQRVSPSFANRQAITVVTARLESPEPLRRSWCASFRWPWTLGPAYGDASRARAASRVSQYRRAYGGADGDGDIAVADPGAVAVAGEAAA